MTLRIHELPDPGHVTMISYQSTQGRAVDAVMAFQDWLPTADRRYGGGATISKDAAFAPFFTFLGPWQEALAGLEAVADPAVLDDSPGYGIDSSGKQLPAGAVPPGFTMIEADSYAAAMALVRCSCGEVAAQAACGCRAAPWRALLTCVLPPAPLLLSTLATAS